MPPFSSSRSTLPEAWSIRRRRSSRRSWRRAPRSSSSSRGAAHPVTLFGENKKDDIMMEKAENDLAAQARSIAQNRSRNVDVAEKIVRDSVSLTDREALDQKVIDVISRD